MYKKQLNNYQINKKWEKIQLQDEVGYQPISEKETADLKALMSGCDTAISAADEFADRFVIWQTNAKYILVFKIL